MFCEPLAAGRGGSQSGSAGVTVTAMDYAAYGRLKPEVKGKCGPWEPVRILVGGQEKDFVTIPMDENDNLIADRMDEPQNGVTEWGYGGDTGRDDDKHPQGDGRPGDGLTAFEEYRGFLTRGVNFTSGCDDRGIADYSKALEINPKYWGAYINRGLNYARKGDYEKAISDYDKALEINLELVLAHFNKAIAYEKLGHKEEAIEAYKNVIQKGNPQEHAPLIEHAKGRIEELEQKKK